MKQIQEEYYTNSYSICGNVIELFYIMIVHLVWK